MKKEDITLEYESLVEFEITEDFSILYSHTADVWFIEDYSEDGKITFLEDLSEGIPMEEIFIYKDVEITEEQLEKYKEIVQTNY